MKPASRFLLSIVVLNAFTSVYAQSAADEAGSQHQISATFPSNGVDPSQIKIKLVRHGCYGSCSQYAVIVFGDGKVLYQGTEFVRVKGKVRALVPDSVVEDLIRRINSMDFFSIGRSTASGLCVEGGHEGAVTVSEPGRDRTIEDQCFGSEELDSLEEAIDKSVDIQQWVFIRAAEMRRQILLGWDVAKRGKSYAQQAIEWNDPEVMRVLIESGVPIESRNHHGDSLLLQAVLRDRYQMAKVLLELGANPRTKNPATGWGAAQNAANRSIEMCKLFLERGVGVNEQDGFGDTMLMNASDSPNHLAIVKFLVDSGASPNPRNSFGETAIGIAKRMRQQIQQIVDWASTPIDPTTPGLKARLIEYAQATRDSNIATVREYDAIIEYLRQHGGTE